MKVIGLCGGSGSGKGIASEFFKQCGIPTIDTDAVYHDLTSGRGECLSALSEEFGCQIISPEGSLDREALKKLVFEADGAELNRQRLNEISHRFILSKTEELLREFEALGKPAAVVDAPLLFESGFNEKCDFIVCVVADRDIRIERIIKRDNISKEEAERRIVSQIPDEQLSLSSDFTIVNNGNPAELLRSVREIADRILN